MTLSVISSPSVSWWLWEALIALVAGAGGGLVFWGLWKEGPPGDEPFPDIDAFRRHKAGARRGWNILMAGIALEIAVAVVFAVKDGWQAKQIKIAIAANDPLKRPVNSMKAEVFLWISATNSTEARMSTMMPWIPKAMAQALVLPKHFVFKQDTAIGSLRCTEYEVRPIPEILGGGTIYSLGFSWPSGNLDDKMPQGSGVPTKILSVEEFKGRIGSLEVSILGIGETNAEIKEGSCSLLVNDSPRLSFEVPKLINHNLLLNFPIITNTTGSK
jgi:hypothetical protein